MNLYRNVLKQSWRITWRYKFLWFFGFLASFWSIGSAYEIFYKSISLGDRDTMLITLWKDLAMSGLTFGKIGEAIINAPLSALSALLFTAR